MYFYGGHAVEGHHGAQSPSYVNYKMHEYYPNCDINNVEELIKNDIFPQSEQTYISEMIMKEKEKQIYPEKYSMEEVMIKNELIDELTAKILNYFNPHKLLDCYIKSRKNTSLNFTQTLVYFISQGKPISSSIFFLFINIIKKNK